MKPFITFVAIVFLVIGSTAIWPLRADTNAIEFKDSPDLLKEIKRLETLTPEQSPGLPKYEESGHQYTTYIVAVLAGIEWERAHKLAYFAQFPDEIDDYSATSVAFDLSDIDYRKQIMSTLHSLHGGNNEAIRKRRKDLKALVMDGIKNRSLKDYQIGLIIHAFADSYAHTFEEEGEQKAFGYIVGHLWHGHQPDIIVYAPEKYKEYACALFLALSLKRSCLPILSGLFALIDRLKISRNAELPEFKEFATEEHDFFSEFYGLKGESWKQSVTKQDVLATLNAMESKFSIVD